MTATHVAFRSETTNLVTGDTNHDNDVFVHDLTGGAPTRENVSSAPAQASGTG